MADRIGKKEIVQQLATRMQTSEKVASEWLEAILETLYANFKEGKGVTLTGFGGFYVQPRGRTMVVPDHIEFREHQSGEFQFGAVEGSLDYRIEPYRDSERLEFSWWLSGSR